MGLSGQKEQVGLGKVMVSRGDLLWTGGWGQWSAAAWTVGTRDPELVWAEGAWQGF